MDLTTTDLLARFDSPSASHPLGIDYAERDELVRLSTSIGVAAGYFGGRLDALPMRITDGMIALPPLIVLKAHDLTKLELARSGAAGV